MSDQTVTPRLLRTAQAARYLGMGTKAVRKLILAGELRFIQLQAPNGPFLVDKADLDKFIESRKQRA